MTPREGILGMVDSDVKESAKRFIEDLKAGRYRRPDRWWKEMGFRSWKE